MGEHRHNPNVQNPTAAAMPPPALVAQGAMLYLSRATGPDGSALCILSARNAVVEAQAPMTADDVDKLIAALTQVRQDMPGGLIVAADLPAGNGRH